MKRIATLLFPAAMLVAAVALAADPPRAGSSFRDCDACPEMVVIPSGTFVMGTPQQPGGSQSRAAEADATVILLGESFALARYEVTRAQFARFVADSGHEPNKGCRIWDPALARYNDDQRRTWENPGTPVELRDDHPVACVSHADATAYVRWLARKTRKPYRLPSESEWEYVARAGNTGLRPWGDDPSAACEHANTYDVTAAQAYRLGWPNAGCRDGYADLAPVGQFKANAFGVHDMIGNVAEWVEDCATGSYLGRPRDARAWVWLGGCNQRIQRGGSWNSPPAASRSAQRSEAPAMTQADFTGFRVALSLESRDRRGED